MKSVLVTGASGGIGGAISTLLGKNGYRVCLHANNNKDEALRIETQLKREGIDAATFCCDLSKEIAIEEMFASINAFCGGIDVLVNNAGISLIKPFDVTTVDEWDSLFSVNTKSQFLCARSASKHMISRKYGRIINISSMWGMVGSSCEVAYSASKSAVIGFTKSLAKELAPSGITVNCIAPGLIKTKMNSHLADYELQDIIDATPLQRIGNPEDVANAVLYFASEQAGFITGQVLVVDGGLTL